MDVLLTNDDGYRSPGLRAIADMLDRIADVTVVAPMEDQSGCGRVVSGEVTIEEIPRGFAVAGTPVDCVIVGIDALDLDPDVVVSGCNVGGNLGRYVLGRSGTVSAALEATFHDLPAIAVSLYVPDPEWPLHGSPVDFVEAVRATRFLLDNLSAIDGLNPGGYFNVNAPLPGDDPAQLQLTQPSDHYAMTAWQEEDRIVVDDRIWTDMSDEAISEPIETDRGAVRRGEISVSALQLPSGVRANQELADVFATFQPEVQVE